LTTIAFAKSRRRLEMGKSRRVRTKRVPSGRATRPNTVTAATPLKGLEGLAFLEKEISGLEDGGPGHQALVCQTVE